MLYRSGPSWIDDSFLTDIGFLLGNLASSQLQVNYKNLAHYTEDSGAIFFELDQPLSIEIVVPKGKTFDLSFGIFDQNNLPIAVNKTVTRLEDGQTKYLF